MRRLDPLLLTPPAKPLAFVAELKRHLRVDDLDRDMLIQELIDSAVAHYDGWSGVLNRCLLTQTWAEKMEALSALRIPLTLGPVSSIVSVTYYDAQNTQQTLPASVYRLQKASGYAYLELIEGQAWPSVYSRDDAVTITYVAGYGPDPTDVPGDIRAAIRLHVEANFESPNTDDVARLELAQARLTAKYRRVGF